MVRDKGSKRSFAVFMAMMLIILVCVVILWSIKRRPDVGFRVGPIDSAGELAPSVAGVTFGSLSEGNRVELVQNGAYFQRLFADVAAARESVHFETFLWEEGAIGEQFAALLAKKAASGVEVRLQLDSSGTRPIPEPTLEMMRRSGCRISKYHPITPANLGRINNRTHRKIAVIDGAVGYVGGHCITPKWLGNARNRNEYRDITARVTGPVVNEIQSAFLENWIESTGEVPVGSKYFPALGRAGSSRAHLVYASPTGTASAVEVLYYLAIVSARHRIVIQNPYFLPDEEMVKALVAAVKRGVDVSLMIPAVEVTDEPIVQHASHHYFGTLLDGGVKVYEYRRSLLHQKTIVVDGQWACVGSTNFDNRSFELNDEVTLSVFDPAVAAELERTFAADLGHARALERRRWRSRGPWHRTVDGIAYLVKEQL